MSTDDNIVYSAELDRAIFNQNLTIQAYIEKMNMTVEYEISFDVDNASLLAEEIGIE